jgi:hypothetical protein
VNTFQPKIRTPPGRVGLKLSQVALAVKLQNSQVHVDCQFPPIFRSALQGVPNMILRTQLYIKNIFPLNIISSYTYPNLSYKLGLKIIMSSNNKNDIINSFVSVSFISISCTHMRVTVSLGHHLLSPLLVFLLSF